MLHEWQDTSLMLLAIACTACVFSDDVVTDDQGEMASAESMGGLGDNDDVVDSSSGESTMGGTTTGESDTDESSDGTTGESADESTGESTDSSTDSSVDESTDSSTGGGVPEDICRVIAFGDLWLALASTHPDMVGPPMTPDPNRVYFTVLPNEALGYVQLQLPGPDTTQLIVSTTDIEYTLTTAGQPQVEGPREPIAGCESYSAQSVYFPDSTPVVFEFPAEGPREIELMVVQVSP